MIPFLAALMLMAQDPAAATAAEAAPAPTAAPAAAPAVEDDENRVVCVIETQTGSYFSKKTCLTKAQWKKKRESRRNNVDRMLTVDTNAGTGN